jgi:hypothetical protein
MNAVGGLGQTGAQDKRQIFEQGQKALKSFMGLHRAPPSSIHRLLNLRNSGKMGRSAFQRLTPKGSVASTQ